MEFHLCCCELGTEAADSAVSDFAASPGSHAEELWAAKSASVLLEPSQVKPFIGSDAKSGKKRDVRAAGIKVEQTITTWAFPFLKQITLYNNTYDKHLYFREQ